MAIDLPNPSEAPVINIVYRMLVVPIVLSHQSGLLAYLPIDGELVWAETKHLVRRVSDDSYYDSNKSNGRPGVIHEEALV